MSAEPGDGVGEATVSVVRLERDRWVVTNAHDPAITHHGEWLTDVLAAHRQAVAFHLDRPLTFKYLLGADETADRISRIRAAGEQVAALRREANQAETAIRAERAALIRDLAELRIAPGEIALILGMPSTAIPKDLGTDRDARLARYLYTHTDPTLQSDPSAAERLF